MVEGQRKSLDKGSYLLILKLRRSKRISVGRLGKLYFKKGFYIYVGSAMAHLSKRMERHCRLKKRPHWHIDYLRKVAQFHSIFPISSSSKLECKIAKALSRRLGWKVSGFGSSDCRCESHLFGMEKDPLHSKDFIRWLQSFRRGIRKGRLKD